MYYHSVEVDAVRILCACLYVGLNIRLKSMYGQGLAYERVLESVKNKSVIFFL